MKIALFGGSFDPPHIGHIKIIQTSLKELDIDRIFVCPTYLNPFKKEYHAPPQTRLKWLKKLLKNYQNVSICNYEIKQNRPVPTIETVLYLYKHFQIEKIYLLIGADNLDSLERWKDIKRLKELVKFVIITRDDKKIPKHLKKLTVNVNISSTKLREKTDKRFLPSQIADEVESYYMKKGNQWKKE